MSIDPVAAGAANHQSFFAAEARAQGGVAEERYDGIFTHGDNQDAYVVFPCVPAEVERSFADEVMAAVRARRDVAQVGWWLLDESRSSSLGPKLVARGFGWGWRPNWMSLDIDRLIEDHPLPSDLEISPEPQGFVALRGGQRIGNIKHHVCSYEGAPVGGIYATGVDEEHRRQGIGTALTVASSRALREEGCRYVLLNATGMGEPVYRRAGFDLLGESGQTWWMMGRRIAAPPPDEGEIAFSEAIGTGDLDLADELLRREPRDLDAILACGETAMGVAVATSQEPAARWLIERGAVFDVLYGWRLGWRDDVVAKLKAQPELANRRVGGMGFTPLHEAVVNDDRELAEAVLSAHPDPTLTDAVRGSTALEWAHFLGRSELEQLIAARS